MQGAVEPSAADLANAQLVERMIAEGALWSPALIAAFRATARHRFIDRVFVFQRRRNRWREILTREPDAEQLDLLYSDRALITGLSPARRAQAPVPISSSSQPSLMAQMLQDLELAPGLRVLEIGTGTGYNAALIAAIVGPRRVTSVDVDPDVLSRAWTSLHGFPELEIQIHHADGRGGFTGNAPYDRLIVTAAAVDIEPAWLEQVSVGGCIVAPLMLAPGLEFIVRGTVTRERCFEGQLTRAAYFMPLRGEGEAGSSADDDEAPGGVRTERAPWANWFERRRLRPGWASFSQSLTFLAFLQGLEVQYRYLDSGAVIALRERGTRRWTWLGQEQWRFADDPDEALAAGLWQQFLALGGPWPTEYRLTASPQGRLECGEGAFFRQGPRCQQCWQLLPTRKREAWI